MTVADQVAARQIREVVHFTSSHGCLGTLYTKLLQSRQSLEGDEMVKYLFKPNSVFRKDTAYLNYVSLSISGINWEFYKKCADSWHRLEPIFWCILAFDPVVLTHAGVIFSTTNNIYSGVRRGRGREGFDLLFADQVVRWSGNLVQRKPGTLACQPTCFQAEALYPLSLSTDFLKRIYVKSSSDQSEVIGFLRASFHPEVDVLVAPARFEGVES